MHSPASPPWTAVIPMRAGSRGLPNKNLLPLAGKPLFWHTLLQAQQAGASQAWITTDIERLELPPALTLPVQVLARPASLATHDTPMLPVLLHLLANTPVAGTLVLLQPTSPLRQSSDIEQALALHQRGEYDLVMSVTHADSGVLKWGQLQGERFVPLGSPEMCFANRQSLPPVVKPNGAVYVFNAEWLRQHQSLATPRSGVVVMPAQRSQDIDNAQDMADCEAWLSSASNPTHS